jgi:uncharacterized paraquat-inducible protein A
VKASPVREESHELVRCLDCGAVYKLPFEQEEALPCPKCEAVIWVALDRPEHPQAEKRS